MTVVDEDLRNTWVCLIDDRLEGEHVSASLEILSIVTGDHRLHTRTITTEGDIRETAKIIAEGIDDLRLRQIGIEDPEQLRDSFVRQFIARHIERVERQDLTPEDLYDFDDSGVTLDGRHDVPAQDSGQVTTVSHRSGDESESDADSAEQNIEDSDTGSDGQSSDEFPFHPTNVNLSEIVEDRSLSPEISWLTEHGFDLESSEPNLEYLNQNRGRLATIIEEQDGTERLLGLIAFSHIAIDTPEAGEPWLGVIEDAFGTFSNTSRSFALLIYLAIAREDPTALVGHLNPLWEELDTAAGDNRTMVFDIVERVSREAPEQIESRVDYIADGLCDETPRVREPASAVLVRVAADRPETISAYTGMITRQLEYDDGTGNLAADLLLAVVKTKPAAVAPYNRQIVSEVTPDISDEKLKRLLGVLRHLLSKDAIDAVPLSDVIDCLDSNDADVRGEVMAICNEVAKRNPERVQQDMSRIVQYTQDDDDQVVQTAALVMSTMAEAQTDTVEPFAKDAVALIQREEKDRCVDIGLNVLGSIAQDRPGSVIPYLDTVVKHLQASDTRRVGLAAQIVGYIARDSTSAVKPHLEQILEIIQDSADADILIPLLDAIRQLVAGGSHVVDSDLDIIVAQTDHERMEVGLVATKVCQTIASIDASAIGAHFDRLLPLLESNHDQVGQACVRVCQEVADADPSRIEEQFEWLLDRVRHPDDKITEPMVLALCPIVRQRPVLINDVPHEWYLTHEDLSLRAAAATALVIASSEYESVLIDNIEPIIEMLDAPEADQSLPALAVCQEIVSDHPNVVAEHSSAIAEFLSHENEAHRRGAFDCLEQLARNHDPEIIQSYKDTIIEHQSDESPEVRRDVALCLSHLAEVDEQMIESEFYRLQQLLEQDHPEVLNGATMAIVKVAEHYPEVAQQATEQIIDRLHDDGSNPKVSMEALRIIAEAHPARLKPHLDAVAEMLPADDKRLRTKVICVFGHTSHASGESITPYLAELRSAAMDLDVNAPMIDILYNVAREDAEPVIDHLDLVVDIANNGEGPAAKRALTTIYYISEERPELVGEHIECIANALESDEKTIAKTSAYIFGSLSNTIPEVVEPYSDPLVDFLQRIEDDDAKLPAVDTLYNVAVESPDTIEPHLDAVKDIDTEDETLASLKRELVGLYEAISDDDQDSDPDPDYDLGQATTQSRPYENSEIAESIEGGKGGDEAPI